MASIKKISGKHGIAFKITVSEGRSSGGKQVRHYMTYVPPDGMSESRALKAAEREAIRFEERLKQGYRLDEKICFEDYSAQFLENKLREGMKQSTCDRYVLLLRRINPAIGHLKLQEIRPQHLNQFYSNLMEPDLRFQPQVGIPKADLTAIMKQKKLSQEKLAQMTNSSPSTIRKARQGNAIHWEKAEAIASALEIPANKLFQRKRNSTALSNKSVLEHHRVIRAVLGQAEKELLVPYNAASKATPPKVRRPEVNTFQPNEITDILTALETEPLKWRCIVHLMIVTGCRRGEIMGLKWNQVDFDSCMLHICETLLALDTGTHSDTPKTPESRRYIKIPRETSELLLQLRTAQAHSQNALGEFWQDTGYVFTQDNGLPMHPDSVNHWLNKFSKRHGLRHINPHAFRHSMASILINNGTDILSISRRLGHTKASTTLNFYGHILQEADARSSDCIAEVLLRKKGTEDTSK